MDFEPTQQTRELIARFRDFVAREIEPIESEILGAPFYTIEPRLDTLRDEARARGLWAPQLPVELGGMGLGLVDHGLVSEVLGGYPYGHYVCGCQAPDAGNVEILHAHGTPRQKEEYLAPIAQGRMRSCFAMTEPELPGSNPTLLATTAVLEGDEYVLDGHKWYATAADGAAVAVVMAITSPEATKYRRASMILVPTDTPGFEIVRNIPVMGHAGEGWPSHGEIRLDGCRVPASRRLGPEGEGFAIAQERLGPGRIHHCMRWLGVCGRTFDLMCRYAVSRRIAPGERLADRDVVRVWIAECAAEIRAARLLTLQTAWLVERDGWRAARQDISAIKFLVAGVMARVVDRALQVHGSLGMSDDTPIAWFYREERGARIYDGPDEVHKISLAKRILRDYEPRDDDPRERE